MGELYKSDKSDSGEPDIIDEEVERILNIPVPRSKVDDLIRITALFAGTRRIKSGHRTTDLPKRNVTSDDDLL